MLALFIAVLFPTSSLISAFTKNDINKKKEKRE